MLKKITIEAQERKEIGKEAVKKLRDQGFLIGNLYGKSQASIPLTMNYIEIRKSLFTGNGKNNLYEIKLGGKSYDAVPYELQLHPLTKEVVHIDFKMVKEDEKVKVRVPVKPIGTAVGTKKGGALKQLVNVIVLSVLPGEIPHYIEPDVSSMDIGAEMRISELPLPASAEVLKLPMNQKVFLIQGGTK